MKLREIRSPLQAPTVELLLEHGRSDPFCPLSTSAMKGKGVMRREQLGAGQGPN